MTTTLDETHTEPEFARYSDLNFTVHEYLNSASDVRTSQNAVLGKSYGILRAAFSGGVEWNSSKFVLGNRRTESKSSYVFNKTPPAILAEKKCVKEIKDWGSQVSEDEVFNLHDLEDFAVSNLNHILRVGNAPAPEFFDGSAISTKRAQNEDSPADAEPKRRKLNLGSMYHVIPQPHIHPSPFSPSDIPVKGRPYKKVASTLLAPYTTLPASNDIRLGWLIPVRGTFHWDLSTSGELLDNSNSLPFPPNPGTSDRVSWTEDSLIKFWHFLLELRKVGSLGPLGISFHASRNDTSSSATKFHSSRSGSTPPKDTTDAPTFSPKLSSNISMVDYIKVYHDAPKALYVRSALDIWQYQLPCEDGRMQKIRVLKGARLVLVDEVSQGVLIS